MMVMQVVVVVDDGAVRFMERNVLTASSRINTDGSDASRESE